MVIFVKLLVALSITLVLKVAALYWRVGRYGVDDPDPRGQRLLMSQFIDGVLAVALSIAVWWFIAAGHREGQPWTVMYAAVFVAAFAVAVTTRFALARFRRFSDFEMKVAFLSRLVESVVLAALFTGITYPIYRWIWIK